MITASGTDNNAEIENGSISVLLLSTKEGKDGYTHKQKNFSAKE